MCSCVALVCFLQAKDRGEPPLSSTATVRIIVNDVNDNAPVFNETYAVQVPESTLVNTALLQVHASDADVDLNAKVRYRIDDTDHFDIDSDSGLLTLRRSLDYELRTHYHLTVTASDSSVQHMPLSTFTTIVVSVSDVNEFSPRFPVYMYLETVMEKQSPGTLVFIAQATDLDAGEFGVVAYQMVTLNDDVTAKFAVDQMSGVVTTREELLYTDGLHYDFEISATDSEGRSARIPVRVSVEPNFEPRFDQSQFSFTVTAIAEVGDIVGRVGVENSDGVTFSLRPPNPYFDIDSATGVIRVIKNLQSDDNSDETARRRRNARMRRALTSNEVTLTVVASVGFPAQTSEATIVISVDRTCEGCSPGNSANVSGNNGDDNGGDVTLVIVIVFVVIAVVVGFVIVGFLIRARSRRARKNKDAARFGPFSPAADGTNHNGVGPPPYNDQFFGHLNGQLTSSDVTVDSQSSPAVSSGRGSAEVDVDEDEEIRMINSTQGSVVEARLPPDSGVQDDDAMSEHSAKDHNEYLARLGIDTSKLKSSQPQNKAQSVESMHQFSDEGGGEGDGMDTFQYSAIPQETMAPHENTQQFGFETPLEQNKAGSLSSVINSEEEFSGSYNWDYLLDWGPQYQPLADVFTEIARLKDDSIKPRKAPTKIVPQSNTVPYSHAQQQQQQHQLRQPPIIIDAPPSHTIQLGHPGPSTSAQYNSSSSHVQPKTYMRERKDSSSSSLTANSLARTSQLTSLSNLPKSPISYESSFTATPLSPEFENCLSPLQHHSPTFSPIVSTGHNTPNHQPPGLATAHSSGSEQEIHI